MARIVLFGLFIVLLVERMLDLDLSLVRGLSLKNAYIYSILALLALGALMRGRIGLSMPPYSVNLGFSLLLGYAALSWYFAPELNPWNLPYDRAERFVALKQFADQYMLFLAFMILAATRASALWLSHAVLAFVALTNVVTLIDVFDVVDLGIIHEREDGRVSGTMGESNQYGAFLTLFLPMILAMPFVARGPRRLLWTLAAVASTMALLLTVSRGAFSGLVVGAVLGCAYLYRYIPRGQLSRGMLVAAAVGVVAVAGILLQYGDLLYARLYEQTAVAADLTAASSLRTAIWSQALAALTEHPSTFLIGGGWDMYENMTTQGFFSYNTHNTYLTYLYDLGVIGLALYLLVVLGVLRTAKRAIAALEPHQRTELLMFVIGFIALLWAVFFVNLFRPWLLIWAYIGLMMRLALEALEPAPEEARAQPLLSDHSGTEHGYKGRWV